MILSSKTFCRICVTNHYKNFFVLNKKTCGIKFNTWTRNEQHHIHFSNCHNIHHVLSKVSYVHTYFDPDMSCSVDFIPLFPFSYSALTLSPCFQGPCNMYCRALFYFLKHWQLLSLDTNVVFFSLWESCSNSMYWGESINAVLIRVHIFWSARIIWIMRDVALEHNCFVF